MINGILGGLRVAGQFKSDGVFRVGSQIVADQFNCVRWQNRIAEFMRAIHICGLLHDLAAQSWPRPPLRELPAIVDEVRARLTYTLG